MNGQCEGDIPRQQHRQHSQTAIWCTKIHYYILQTDANKLPSGVLKIHYSIVQTDANKLPFGVLKIHYYIVQTDANKLPSGVLKIHYTSGCMVHIKCVIVLRPQFKKTNISSFLFLITIKKFKLCFHNSFSNKHSPCI